VAGALRRAVRQGGVFGVDAGQSSSQRIGFLRRDHQMHVIGHETVTQNSGAMADGIVTEQIEVSVAIAEGTEYRLAVVAPLSDVMGNAGKHDSGTTGRIRIVRRRGNFLKVMRLSPLAFCRIEWYENGHSQ
jgi:hypothetical protein